MNRITKKLLPSLGLAIASIASFLQYAFAAFPDTEQARRDKIVVEALMRLDGVDIYSDPKLENAVQRHLSELKNDPSQLKIIQKLKVTGLSERLVDLAALWGENTQSVQALELAIEQGAYFEGKSRRSENPKESQKTSGAVGAGPTS